MPSFCIWDASGSAIANMVQFPSDAMVFKSCEWMQGAWRLRLSISKMKLLMKGAIWCNLRSVCLLTRRPWSPSSEEGGLLFYPGSISCLCWQWMTRKDCGEFRATSEEMPLQLLMVTILTSIPGYLMRWVVKRGFGLYSFHPWRSGVPVSKSLTVLFLV